MFGGFRVYKLLGFGAESIVASGSGVCCGLRRFAGAVELRDATLGPY